jgi:ABC-type antimicrobial peptide transport system permease subunit
MLARSMGRILYGISPFDVPAFSIAAFVLVAAGLFATWLPARRATRVDPMVALRDI